ncbi:MAG: hypothetical protein CMP10_13120, partial [Zetaproteobacteria bacterium]|nr:hypothetical protein [Pseudobdellovibrionaceae bacterium]
WIYVVGAGLQILSSSGMIRTNFFTESSYQIGMGIEVIILSLALARNLKRLQEEKAVLQQNAAANLKSKVDERTQELTIKTKEAEKLQEKAESQAVQLQELDKQKTVFFQNMSHELRTPLTLILNPLENLTQKFPEERHLSIVEKNAKRLLRLVNQLLDFQKITAGKKQLKLTPLDLQRLTLLCSDYFEQACQVRGIDYDLKRNNEIVTTSSPPLWVLGEVDAIEKIIFNYLSNALKYTPDGGRIEVNLIKGDNSVRLNIVDTGQGITEEAQEKLFKVFSQVDDTSLRTHEGSGLGLALVKSLAEEMGGQVGVESSPNQGSVFWVDFPLLTPEQLTLEQEKNGQVNEAALDENFKVKPWLLDPVEGKTGGFSDGDDATIQTEGVAQILVIDDLNDMRDLVANNLRRHQYGVATAANGRLGLESVMNHTPDLIITDWMMPEMTGPELISQLKADKVFASIPVILLTAKTDEESKIIGTEIGADGFLGKPFNDQELLSLVRNLLQLKASEKELRLTHEQLKQSSEEKIRDTKNLLTQAEKLAQLGSLLAGIGHEISSPISMISLGCSNESMLLQKLEKKLGVCFDFDDEATRSFGDQIQHDIDELREVNSNIKVGSQRLKDLSVALRTQSRMEHKPTAGVDLNEVIRESMLITGGQIKYFDIEQSFGELSVVTCFRSKLGQVVTNLLANASDALMEKKQRIKEESGQIFQGKILISTMNLEHDGRAGIQVMIEDNGDGVPEHLRQKILEKFYTTKEAGKGTGLGLALCVEIMEEHGGQLLLSDKSLLGGAKFELWLPVEPVMDTIQSDVA